MTYSVVRVGAFCLLSVRCGPVNILLQKNSDFSWEHRLTAITTRLYWVLMRIYKLKMAARCTTFVVFEPWLTQTALAGRKMASRSRRFTRTYCGVPSSIVNV